jgi:peroxiredoxin
LGISVDSPFALKAFKEANRLNFPLLSDFNRTVIAMYDVVQANLLGLPLFHLAKRAVYIIDPTSTIRYVWHSDDPRNEPPYDEVIKETENVAAELKKCGVAVFPGGVYVCMYEGALHV